ncbi:hypothetical protein [Sinorhizobium fredii]|uniref:hypothetical protein n=1 Tax=Rhizobium fredii TaxID=380 RepID=UPI003519A6BE
MAGKTDFAFEDSGERTLKNIAQPVRVWRWARDQAPATAAALLPLPGKPSIAVLPFDNLSSQPEETYFSDGITEDIITGLARFRSLFVIARNSSFAFRGKPIDLAEIGRRLGVSYLLEGSVRRSGDRVRITAQLIEAATGAHLWAERYDRSLDDIFAVQEEVAQMIVAALFGRIQEADFERSSRMPTASLTAYDCLLRGLAHFRPMRRTRTSAPASCSRKRSRSVHVTPWHIHISLWCGSRSMVGPPRRPRFWTPHLRGQDAQSNSIPKRAAATEFYRKFASSAASTTWPKNMPARHST